jgi:hypothetical protein
MTTRLHLHDRPVRRTNAAYGGPVPNQADRAADSEEIHGQQKSGGNNLEFVLVVLVSVVLMIFGLRLLKSENHNETDSAKTEFAE